MMPAYSDAYTLKWVELSILYLVASVALLEDTSRAASVIDVFAIIENPQFDVHHLTSQVRGLVCRLNKLVDRIMKNHKQRCSIAEKTGAMLFAP